MLKKTIDIPIYLGKLTIVIVQDFEKLTPVLKKRLGNGFKRSAAMVTSSKDKEGRYEYIVAFWPNYMDPDVVSHECLHLMSRIFRHRGIAYDVDNDENAAYLLGWLVKQCYKFIHTHYDFTETYKNI